MAYLHHTRYVYLTIMRAELNAFNTAKKKFFFSNRPPAPSQQEKHILFFALFVHESNIRVLYIARTRILSK